MAFTASQLPGLATCFSCLGRGVLSQIKIYCLSQLVFGTAVDGNTLEAAASGYDIFTGDIGLAAKAYLLALITGNSTVPSALVPQASCFFSCIQDGNRQDVETYLIAASLGNTNAPQLATAASLYQRLKGDYWKIELYLLAQMAGVTSIQQILNGATCFFSCLQKGMLQDLNIFLLNFGLKGANIVPPGSTYGPGAQFCIAILPNTSYQITWGSNDVSATVCGDTYTSTGVGTSTVFYSGSCTQLCLTGIAQGTTVTAVINPVHNVCTPPTGLALSYNPSGLINVSWNVPPSNVAATEVWTSTDGVNFSLVATITAPGTSTTVNPAGAAQTLYVQARSDCSAPNVSSSFTKPQTIFGNWAQRVINNGGAQPSQATLNALQTFIGSIYSTTVWNKLIWVNFVAPDSLIAAKTPLIVGGGNDPCIDNTASVAGCLSVNGWAPSTNANNHSLQIGLNMRGTFSTTDTGLSLYLYQAVGSGNPNILIGGYDASSGLALFTDNNSGNPRINQFDAYNNGTDSPSWQLNSVTGFLSGNRIDGTATGCKIYWASSVQAWGVQGTSSASATLSPPNVPLAFCGGNANGTYQAPQGAGAIVSFGAIHHGLTSAEGQTLYNAVQAFRVALGGGFR